MSVQSPSAVVMVRPHHFAPNPQTLADNGFQPEADGLDPERIAAAAYDEVTRALEEEGVHGQHRGTGSCARRSA